MEKLSYYLGQTLTDKQAIKFAITIAKQGMGYVEPNPPVGCVILDQKNILIGYGYHEKFGESHAEVNAVASVVDKNNLQGSKVFVTLEPCGHQGQTPPCSELLIKSKISTLIYICKDPNPLFNHSGIKAMSKSNIEVKLFTKCEQLVKEAYQLVDKFLFDLESNKSFVSLKFASSLDGQIGLNNGESKWITNQLSREHAQGLRAQHDAVLVGLNTFINDNPSLNIRSKSFEDKKNKVIILDPKFKCKDKLLGSNLEKNHAKKDIYIACTNNYIDKKLGYSFINIASSAAEQINFNKFRIDCKEEGIKSILVEGGAETISGFVKQKEFNVIHNFIAPIIIGAKNGLSWTKGYGIDNLQLKLELTRPVIIYIGDDILYTTRLRSKKV